MLPKRGRFSTSPPARSFIFPFTVYSRVLSAGNLQTEPITSSQSPIQQRHRTSSLPVSGGPSHSQSQLDYNAFAFSLWTTQWILGSTTLSGRETSCVCTYESGSCFSSDSLRLWRTTFEARRCKGTPAIRTNIASIAVIHWQMKHCVRIGIHAV